MQVAAPSLRMSWAWLATYRRCRSDATHAAVSSTSKTSGSSLKRPGTDENSVSTWYTVGSRPSFSLRQLTI